MGIRLQTIPKVIGGLLEDRFYGLVQIAAVVFAFYGVGLLVGQILFWLKHGIWIEIPVTALCRVDDELNNTGPLQFVPNWGCASTGIVGGWKGVEKILQHTHLAVCIWVLALMMVMWSFSIAEERAKKPKEEQ